MKAIALTPPTLYRLQQFSIDSSWFDAFQLPPNAPGIKRVQIDDIVYLLDSDLDSDDGPIVVINLTGKHPVFKDGDPNQNTLDRITTVARSIFTNSVKIPASWRPHREGHLFSVQAPAQDKNWRARLHFEYQPQTRDLFVFAKTDEIVDFDGLHRDDLLFNAVRSTLPDAILSPAPVAQENGSFAGITLSQRLPQGFVQGASLQQWLDNKLTTEQRDFVERPHDGPIRLRGTAGTGKTLSLVIKFLRDGMSVEGASIPSTTQQIKFGFVTHSHASVDLVQAIAESLDTTGLIHGQGQRCKLEIRTLYDLAYEHLHFGLDNLSPLSLDGREGRKLQFELIESILREFHSSPILSLQYAEISHELKDRWDLAANGQEPRLVAEIMNEFASILDADAVRAGEEKGERYAKSASLRPNWLMALPLEIDRRFILDVHRRYRKLLSDMNTLSVDQMIGDFNSFLDSNRWDRIKDKQGYDALFVDELHLFTSIERQTLHKLIKRNVEENGKPVRPPIFMAYDLKQSPRDTFIQYGDAEKSLFGSSTGLQNSALVKFDQVFRFTPQIAEFLADLDSTFPAIDIPGEWGAYSGKAQLSDGTVPELTVYADETMLFRSVFREAEQVARSIDGGGRRVAILCVSGEHFDKYLTAASGQFSGRHIAITSREPSSELRHAGKRFIFSMPEYVAGLQFDTVFLIHVDAADSPINIGDGPLRQFISNVYLGSSRAENTLKLSACLSRGGASEVLRMALERNSLIQVAPGSS